MKFRSGPTPNSCVLGELVDRWLYATMGGGEDNEGRRLSGTAGFCMVDARGMFSGATGRGQLEACIGVEIAHADAMMDDAHSVPPIPRSLQSLLVPVPMCPDR